MSIIQLKFLGASQEEIAEDLCVDTAWVSEILKSELAKEVLAGMRARSIEKTLDLKQALEGILIENLDLPKQVIKGRIKEIRTTTNEDGSETEEEVEVTVGHRDRMAAYKTVGQLAGVGQQNVPLSEHTVNVDRLIIIKERAKEQKEADELSIVEDADFSEVEENTTDETNSNNTP